MSKILFVPCRDDGNPSLHDEVEEDGVTLKWSHSTVEEVQKRYPDAVVLDAEEAHARYREGFRMPPTRITGERYTEMLEVLPPAKMGTVAGWRVFQLSELRTMDIAYWFGAFLTKNPDTLEDDGICYQMADSNALTIEQVAERFAQALAEEEAAKLGDTKVAEAGDAAAAE